MILWVEIAGYRLMKDLGFDPLSTLTCLVDEDDARVDGYELPVSDAAAAVCLLRERGLKAYVK